MSYFVDSAPKFTGLVLPDAGGIVFDHVSFFPILDIWSEIFAIKSEVV